MSWSCHMQDVSELIEDRLISYEIVDEKKPSAELISTNSVTPFPSLSQETFEMLVVLDNPLPVHSMLVPQSGSSTKIQANRDEINDNTKRLLTTPVNKLTSVENASMPHYVTSGAVHHDPLSITYQGVDKAANILPPVSSNQDLPSIDTVNDQVAADTDVGYLSNTTITSPGSATAANSHSNPHIISQALTPDIVHSTTRLLTRTTEEVIVDLKQLRSIPGLGCTQSVSVEKGGVVSARANEMVLSEEENHEASEDESEQLGKKPRQHSERKRAENAAIDAYARQHQLRKINKGVPSEDLNKQSARYLLQKQSSAVIISSPREYQLELFERAKEKNVIAVLDTGLYLESECL